MITSFNQKTFQHPQLISFNKMHKPQDCSYPASLHGFISETQDKIELHQPPKTQNLSIAYSNLYQQVENGNIKSIELSIPAEHHKPIIVLATSNNDSLMKSQIPNDERNDLECYLSEKKIPLSYSFPENNLLSNVKGIANHIFKDSIAAIIPLALLGGGIFLLRKPIQKHFVVLNEYQNVLKKGPEAAAQTTDDAIRFIESNYADDFGKKLKAIWHNIFSPENKANKIFVFSGPPGAGKTYTVEKAFRLPDKLEKEMGILRIKPEESDITGIFDMLSQLNNREFRGNILHLLDKKLGAPVKKILVEVDELDTYVDDITRKITQIFGQSAKTDHNGRRVAVNLLTTTNEIPSAWLNNAAINGERFVRTDFPSPPASKLINYLQDNIMNHFGEAVSPDELNKSMKALTSTLDDYSCNFRNFQPDSLFFRILEQNVTKQNGKIDNLSKALDKTIKEELGIKLVKYDEILDKALANHFIPEYINITADVVGGKGKPFITSELSKLGHPLRFAKDLESNLGIKLSTGDIADLFADNTLFADRAGFSSQLIEQFDQKIADKLRTNLANSDIYELLGQNKPANELKKRALEVLKDTLQASNIIGTADNVANVANQTLIKETPIVREILAIPRQNTQARIEKAAQIIETLSEKQPDLNLQGINPEKMVTFIDQTAQTVKSTIRNDVLNSIRGKITYSTLENSLKTAFDKTLYSMRAINDFNIETHAKNLAKRFAEIVQGDFKKVGLS